MNKIETSTFPFKKFYSNILIMEIIIMKQVNRRGNIFISSISPLNALPADVAIDTLLLDSCVGFRENLERIRVGNIQVRKKWGVRP